MSEPYVVPSCVSIYLKNSGKSAVLLIHGYTGHPNDLRYLSHRIHECGYTVHVPRLPGHGTNHKDFLSTNSHDWLEAARNAYLDLSTEYEEVVLLGFSMGGLIATKLAAQYNIKKLILVAPAFQVFAKNLWLTPFIWPIIPKVSNIPEFKGNTQDSKKIYDEYHIFAYTKNVAQFYKMQNIGKSALPSVTANTFVLVSLMDETVPPTVLPLIQNRSHCVNIESFTLEKSPHVNMDEYAPEKDLVAEKITTWLKNKAPVIT
jgi:carboxylesterase